MKKLQLLIAALLLASTTAHTQAYTESNYKAVEVTWPANAASENVGWYTVEFNDEGLADDTYSTVDNTSDTSLVISFERLVEIAGRSNNPLTIDDELCLRVIASKSEGGVTKRSDPSEPACFTMRGPALAELSKPTGVTTKLVLK